MSDGGNDTGGSRPAAFDDLGDPSEEFEQLEGELELFDGGSGEELTEPEQATRAAEAIERVGADELATLVVETWTDGTDGGTDGHTIDGETDPGAIDGGTD